MVNLIIIIERVNACGYTLSLSVWEYQWDQICKRGVEVRGHVDSCSLPVALNSRDSLYRGRCVTFTLHDQSSDRRSD